MAAARRVYDLEAGIEHELGHLALERLDHILDLALDLLCRLEHDTFACFLHRLKLHEVSTQHGHQRPVSILISR